MPVFIALLRGVNVGGNKKVPMAELRDLAAGLGFRDARTYVQSGNLLFGASGKPATLEAKLERAIEQRFGFHVPVIVRGAAQWPGYVRGNPLPAASAKEPHLVHLALSKLPARNDALAALRERATGAERVELAGDAIWIHFAAGSARSRLSPAFLDRVVGSTVTARNWRTVQQLAQLSA